MKKRLFSILLALCMVLCLVPTSVFAEGETEETPVCTCETACTAEAMNTECPVCGAEGALAESCGKYAAEESGQTGASDDAPVITAADVRPLTVTFDPNGGTLADADKTRSLTTGDTYGTLPVPNYEGYDFAGWYTEKNGCT